MSTTPRRDLNARRTETVTRLLAAGAEELRTVGPEALTVRGVAGRAGVSPATAYTYFASRNHLFAELFLREVVEAYRPQADGDTPLDRVRGVTRGMAAALGAAPEIAAGATQALLSADPDVERLRLRIGSEFYDGFRDALGGEGDPVLVETLVLAFSGALLQAGMGVMTYLEMGERLDAAVAVIMEGSER